MTELKFIHNIWLNEVALFKLQEVKLKLIILGEAPLSAEQYFYAENGSYLGDLYRDYYKTCPVIFDFNSYLRKNGIILIEMYQHAIPSSLYRRDSNFNYWDPSYFQLQLETLKFAGLIDHDTKFVFRYKHLCVRLDLKNAAAAEALGFIEKSFKSYGIREIQEGGFFETLTTGANGVVLNEKIQEEIANILQCPADLNKDKIFDRIIELLKLVGHNIPVPNLKFDYENNEYLSDNIEIKRGDFGQRYLSYKNAIPKLRSKHWGLKSHNSDNETWIWGNIINDSFGKNDKIWLNIFEILGYFKMSSPESVFLCPKIIEAYSLSKRIDIELIYLIIYVHECAHYIHHWLNKEHFKVSPFSDFNDKLYQESFAQLVTHLYVEDDAKLFTTFNQLKLNQPSEYIDYCKAYHLGRYESELIKEIFLNTSKVLYSENATFKGVLEEHVIKYKGLNPTDHEEIYLLDDVLSDVGLGEGKPFLGYKTIIESKNEKPFLEINDCENKT